MYFPPPPPLKKTLLLALLGTLGAKVASPFSGATPSTAMLRNFKTCPTIGLLPSESRPLCLLATCLPSRSGCTDPFKEALDYTDSILNILSFDSDVIILGDLNADLGSVGGPLATTTINEQGRILYRYLQKWNYTSVHLHKCSSSNTHTYTSDAHHTSSTIDHILSPKHLLDRFSHSQVLTDEPLNLSDHSPVCATFLCSIPKTPISPDHQNAAKYCPNWAKATGTDLLHEYSKEVSKLLQQLPHYTLSSLTLSPCTIDRLLSEVRDSLDTAAKTCIPAKRFQPHIRPAWSAELKQAHANSKAAYKAWCAAGKPRDTTHQLRADYKAAKATFRTLFRAHQRQQRDLFYQNLDLSDPDKFFHHVRRANGIATEPTSILHVAGKAFQGKELPNAWANYFETLATPADSGYDNNFKELVLTEYTKATEQPKDYFEPFTETEVAEAIGTLKLNKAVGPDGIEPEHIVHAGQSLVSVLTLLFNAINLSSHIPHVFRNGLVIPIPKSSTKDLSDPANYRGIIILSNISKVLEKLVLLRISELDPPPTLNPLQGRFRAGYSCSHMAFLLQEAIIETRSSGGKAFVAFLDVRKAFDTVWHEGLLVKLMNKGIKGHLWHLINSWYTASSGCVLWNGQHSQPFTLLQGVRQGGVLSPFLYCLYVDELLDQLSASKIGASISDIYCGAPMYADDLALVAGSQGALQSLLDMVDRYGRKWRYSLNSSKSVIMVLGEAARTRERERCQREFRLGEEEVLEVDEQHHLGILRSVSSSTIARTNGRAAAYRSAFY